MFKRFKFDDIVGNMSVRTVAYIGFPESNSELGWKVQALIFTRVLGSGGNGNFRFTEIVPDMEIARKVITDVQADGTTNWINALVYEDALDTWLKDYITIDEDTDWINPGKALGIMTVKKRQLGISLVND